MQSLMRDLVPLSLRAPSLVGLVTLYCVLTAYLVGARLELALYLIPMFCLAIVSSFPRLAYPFVLSLTSVGSFALAMSLAELSWTAGTIILTGAQLFTLTLTALLLAEAHARRRAEYLFDRLGAGTIPMDLSSDVVARELRRSRRTESPVSLVLLKLRHARDSDSRGELIDTLTRESREFDTVLDVSPIEVAVLCTSTDQLAAARWIERLDLNHLVSRIAIASFPEDAVTSQGLFDTARRQAVEPARTEVATASVD